MNNKGFLLTLKHTHTQTLHIHTHTHTTLHAHTYYTLTLHTNTTHTHACTHYTHTNTHTPHAHTHTHYTCTTHTHYTTHTYYTHTNTHAHTKHTHTHKHYTPTYYTGACLGFFKGDFHWKVHPGCKGLEAQPQTLMLVLHVLTALLEYFTDCSIRVHVSQSFITIFGKGCANGHAPSSRSTTVLYIEALMHADFCLPTNQQQQQHTGLGLACY